MTPRQIIAAWLRGFLAQPQPSPAPQPEPLAYRYHSIETLLVLPCVTPDRSRYLRPESPHIEHVAWWLQTAYPRAWSGERQELVELIAAALRGLREDVTTGERV